MFITLGSNECIAAIRARAIFFEKVISPLRFFTNSTDLGFSPVDMGRPLAGLCQFLLQAQDDGSMFMDKALDIFAGFEDGNQDEGNTYSEWKGHLANRMGKTIDGSHKVNISDLIDSALYTPEKECEAIRRECITVLEELCKGFLEGMETTPMADVLGGGKYAPGVVAPEVVAALKGAAAHSNIAESVFGAARMHQDMSQMITPLTAVGQAVAGINRTFDPSLFVMEDAVSEAAPSTRWDELHEHAQISATITGQKTVNPATKVERKEKASFVRTKKASIENNAEATMLRQAKSDVDVVRYFHCARWTTAAQVDRELAKLPDEGARLTAIKEQSYIRTKGYRWAELRFNFSVDQKPFSVAQLTVSLKDMIERERGRPPPLEPPLFSPRTRRLEVLGTLTAKSMELRDEVCWTPEAMAAVQAKAATAAADRAAAKERETHDGFALDQPAEPPELDAGLKIEILTPLWEDEREYKQWLPATVLQVSTGAGAEKMLSDKGREVKVPKGFVYLAYDDGLTAWQKLNVAHFNCMRKYSWRLDLDAQEEPERHS